MSDLREFSDMHSELVVVRRSRWRRFRQWIIARICGEWTVVDGGHGGSSFYVSPDAAKGLGRRDEERSVETPPTEWHPSHREIL